jgi:hypothetical protein
MLKKFLAVFQKSREPEKSGQSTLIGEKSLVDPFDPKSLAGFIASLIVSNPPLDRDGILRELKSIGVSGFNAEKSIALTQEAFGHALIRRKNGQPPTEAVFMEFGSSNKLEIDLRQDQIYLGAIEVAEQEALFNLDSVYIVANRSSVRNMLEMAAQGHFKIENLSFSPPFTIVETLD